jgi:uncharacterized protein YutE (UPF0331/DUF86 family)
MENAVINAELCGRMVAMAKFRDVVVYQYEGVDAEIVISILGKHLADFEQYRDAILAYLNRPAA